MHPTAFVLVILIALCAVPAAHAAPEAEATSPYVQDITVEVMDPTAAPVAALAATPPKAEDSGGYGSAVYSPFTNSADPPVRRGVDVAAVASTEGSTWTLAVVFAVAVGSAAALAYFLRRA